MLQDLNQLQANSLHSHEYDVCIVGAGFAGIALALNLPKHLKVLLLEAGGLEFRPEAQDPYQGDIIGREYFPLDACRLRQLGGTSLIWSGWCKELDAPDFLPHHSIPYTGWPLRKTDLDPYHQRAREILDVAPGINWQWGGALDRLEGLETFDFNWSLPLTRMADKYRAQLEASKHIHCLINTNLTDLPVNASGNRITHVEVTDYQQRKHHLTAGKVVIAAGGIETPRLLLNFDKQIPGGIGNQNDLVGRFFMEHPHYDVGHFILDDTVNHRLTTLRRKKDPLITEFIRPTKAFMDQAECLSFGLRVIHWGRRRNRSFWENLGQLLSIDGPLEEAEIYLNQIPTPCRTGGLPRVIAEQDFHSPRAPLTAPCDVDGLIRIASEQAPNPESRVRLNEDIDAFGLRRVALDWQLQPLDKWTMKAAVLKLGEEFARKDIGRVRLVDWLADDDAPIPGLEGEEVGGRHHIGTTRMAESPDQGVVDKNLKVFGVDNLYLCGSSVFPTAGQANPTFTIIQLALRLADHLAAYDSDKPRL